MYCTRVDTPKIRFKAKKELTFCNITNLITENSVFVVAAVADSLCCNDFTTIRRDFFDCGLRVIHVGHSIFNKFLEMNSTLCIDQVNLPGKHLLIICAKSVTTIHRPFMYIFDKYNINILRILLDKIITHCNVLDVITQINDMKLVHLICNIMPVVLLYSVLLTLVLLLAIIPVLLYIPSTS